VNSKTGIQIRPVQKGDAASLLGLFEALDNETTMMLWEPGERGLTLDMQQDRVNGYLDSVTQAMCVAEIIDENGDKNDIVGSAVAIGGKARRNAHVLTIAMGVKRQYWGKGIGAQLLQQLVDWARLHQFVRLELTVMAHNERAVLLYQRLGFEIEGRHVKSLKVDGEWVDEFTMALLL